MSDIPKVKVGLKTIQVLTTDLTVDISHRNNTMLCANVAGATVTLPNDTSDNLPIGFECVFSMAASNPVTFTAEAGATLTSAQFGNSDAVLAVAGTVAVVTKLAANTWGVAGQLAKKRYVFIPIDWMEDGTSPPDAATAVESGAGVIRARTFDYATSEDVKFAWEVPDDIHAALGITYFVKTVITATTGPSEEGVTFKLSGFCSGNGDSMAGTLGTEVKSSWTGVTDAQYDMHETDESGTVTVTDLTERETAFFKLYRDHDDADDDYAQLVGVAGIWIGYYQEY